MCQNSCSQLHMRMTKRTHVPRSANAIFLLVGVWLLLLQEDPTNISILIFLFCFSQCHPHCCMTLPALLRFLLHPPLEDYFPSLPLGGGWGRSQESSLLSAHFNNSLHLNTKIPHVRCGPLLLPRQDHQFGGGLLGGVASQVGLHPEWGLGAICWGTKLLGGAEGRKVGGAGHPAPLPGCETIVQQCH